MDTCIVTRSLEVFEHYIDLSALPVFSDNPALSFDLQLPSPPRVRIYVIKPRAGTSLLDLIGDSSCCEASEEDRAALRVFQVNEGVFARERSNAERDDSYVALLSSLTDPAFTGVLVINACARPKRPADLGPAALVDCFSFVVPCIELTGFDFSGATPVPGEVRMRGYLAGVPVRRPYDVGGSEGDFSFRMDRLCACCAQDRLLAPSLSCAVQIRSLFSQRVDAAPFVSLSGTYAPLTQEGSTFSAYRLSLTSTAMLPFGNGLLASVSLERADATFAFDDDIPRLRLLCGGRLRFGKLCDAFDPLSYGIGESSFGLPEEGYLTYSGLDLRFALSAESSSLAVDYRSLAVDESASCARAGSLALAVPHLPVFMLGHQHAPSPRSLGFRPMTTPPTHLPALADEAWYGLVTPLEFAAGMRIELLCAFSGDGGCSCFSRFTGGVSSDVVELAFSSLFSLRFKDVVMQGVLDQGGKTHYTLLVRGLKLKVLGAQLPEGDCDIALAWSGAAQGWYAVYDRRRSALSYKAVDDVGT